MALEPRAKTLEEMLKEENPGTLSLFSSYFTVDHLYVMLCKTSVFVFHSERINFLLNMI